MSIKLYIVATCHHTWLDISYNIFKVNQNPVEMLVVCSDNDKSQCCLE